MVTLVRVRLFWDGINATGCPHATMHGPLSLPDGHLLHFMSYITPWSGGGVHCNVIEVSVLSINLTSLTGEGTPMKMSTRMSSFCFYLLLATACI